jgi:tripartite-type tricarboxylate transporter receptor subunit TctC
LLAVAKAKPEAANYGSYGTGSSAHILNEHLVKTSGVAMTHVPYKGVAPELQDLAGGQILTAVADIGSAAPLVHGGQIRPVAVTGEKRSALLPDVPTFAEQGVSGLEPFSPWWGVFAPRQTPQPVVELLSREIQKIVNQPDVKAKLAALGIEPTGMLTQDADRTTREEMARWQSIIANLSNVKFE